MDKSIKIASEDYKIIQMIADRENRSYKTILGFAVQNYGKAKQVKKGKR